MIAIFLKLSAFGISYSLHCPFLMHCFDLFFSQDYIWPFLILFFTAFEIEWYVTAGTRFKIGRALHAHQGATLWTCSHHLFIVEYAVSAAILSRFCIVVYINSFRSVHRLLCFTFFRLLLFKQGHISLRLMSSSYLFWILLIVFVWCSIWWVNYSHKLSSCVYSNV